VLPGAGNLGAEASGCLVAPPVFKTGGRRFASPAGSIPVRLRWPLRHREWPLGMTAPRVLRDRDRGW
jgi:hypothetical protein